MLEREQLSLNQFEDLVRQSVKKFADCYADTFFSQLDSSNNEFNTIEDWFELYKAYLVANADQKIEALKIWFIIKNSLNRV